jgi:hypothetical protein
METLNGKILDIQLQNSFVRVVDIMNFEGPLLTLFQDKNNNSLYLFDWVDKNNEYNRWLVYLCDPFKLKEYINGKISHFDLFMSNDSYCYKIDIDENINWSQPQFILKKDLPASYYPSKTSFFEKSDCPDFNTVEQLLDQFTDISPSLPPSKYSIKATPPSSGPHRPEQA